MHDYVPARPDQQHQFVNVAQEEVDESALEIDLLGRDDQDNQATGVKRESDYLADNELDEELVGEVDLIGARTNARERPNAPGLPVPPKLEVSKSSRVPAAPEGGSSSSTQLPAGSSLREHFQKTGVTGPGVEV